MLVKSELPRIPSASPPFILFAASSKRRILPLALSETQSLPSWSRAKNVGVDID
jgi:hypothetical protein